MQKPFSIYSVHYLRTKSVSTHYEIRLGFAVVFKVLSKSNLVKTALKLSRDLWVCKIYNIQISKVLYDAAPNFKRHKSNKNIWVFQIHLGIFFTQANTDLIFMISKLNLHEKSIKNSQWISKLKNVLKK